MKKVAIFTCLKATYVCSGAACFNAIRNRTGTFQQYLGEDVEVVAFFHCNGCDSDYKSDKEYVEKITHLCALRPDAVHVGKCTLINNSECSHISHIISIIETNNIKVVRGTH